MLVTKHDIKNLDRVYRLNLINSITGVKPGNLIGTESKKGIKNLAIFSSVVHLGSNPAQIGIVIRPQIKNLKDTYSNIISTKYYTINHISESFIKKAHYTSAKFPHDESEFNTLKIEAEKINDFHAPFVKLSQVKIGMKHLKNIYLPNGCIFIIGEIELAYINNDALNNIGQIDLESYKAIGIGGLNSYYELKHIESFPYVKLNEIPHFDE